MAPWLEHPRYVAVRDRLIDYLRSERYRFRKLSPVIFLCGGVGSLSRDVLRDYLRKTTPDHRIFYAEQVWNQIATRTGRSALQMEADLALLADLLLIIVQSPGTFAELGAFSLSDDLRRKLLPIVDSKYLTAESFIATGPLRWIDAESRFGPTIYVPLATILEAGDRIEERISRIEKAKPARVEDLATSPKHLLFFISDLVAVIHPATFESVEYYLGRIAPSIVSSKIEIATLLGLAVAMNLLQVRQVRVLDKKIAFFSPSSGSDALKHPFHHRRLLDLPSQRANQIAVLMTIPAAKDVLDSLRNTA